MSITSLSWLPKKQVLLSKFNPVIDGKTGDSRGQSTCLGYSQYVEDAGSEFKANSMVISTGLEGPPWRKEHGRRQEETM